MMNAKWSARSTRSIIVVGNRECSDEGMQNRKITRIPRYRVLICGLLSPVAAIVLYVIVYSALTAASKDLEKDWLFRLSLATLAMTVPFFLTMVLTVKEARLAVLSRSAKVGITLAILSLVLTWKPIDDGIQRYKQSRNLALRDVPAPLFDTLDLQGRHQRLADQRGKVVLVNIWATWCAPCRAEMPKLDQLYRAHSDAGLMVFGLSEEDSATQMKYLQQVEVTYPLLTTRGNVPGIYRDIARYPAIFLIDREGKLHPAPGPDSAFEKVEATVNDLLLRP